MLSSIFIENHIRTLKDRTGSIGWRIPAVNSLACYKNPEATQALFDTLGDQTEDPQLRLAVLTALPKQKDRRDILEKVLDALQNDSDPLVRKEAAGSLWEWREEPGVVDALVKASNDPDDKVSAAAVWMRNALELGNRQEIRIFKDSHFSFVRSH
jgi:hypothetical protein